MTDPHRPLTRPRPALLKIPAFVRVIDAHINGKLTTAEAMASLNITSIGLLKAANVRRRERGLMPIKSNGNNALRDELDDLRKIVEAHIRTPSPDAHPPRGDL